MKRFFLSSALLANFLMILSMLPLRAETKSDLKQRTFAVNQKTVKFKGLIPEGWEALVDVYNTPLTLVSKMGSQDSRSVIQIIPYGVKDHDDSLLKFKKDPEEFYSQKESWLEMMDGESISYEPFEESLADGMAIFSIGIKYKNDLGHFLDKSFYLSSKKKEIFFVKAIIPLDFEKEHSGELDRVVRSLATLN
jgi:hypothetical protein